MEVKYVDREAAWRHRGRPRQAVAPEILTALKRTYDSGTAAELDLDQDDTEESVRLTLKQLRTGAGHLGLRLRVQPRRAADIVAARVLRFYVEDPA